MCTLVAVAMGAEAAGTVIKGIAAKQHGDAVKAADYQSADAAERAAVTAVERGKLEELQVVLRGSNVVEAQRVIQSGTGADVNIGAHKAAQDATESISEIDRSTVAYNAMMEAYGLKSRARAYRQNGVNAQKEGENAMIGTFLGGIAGIGGQIGKFGADRAVPSAGGGAGDTSYGGGDAADEAD